MVALAITPSLAQTALIFDPLLSRPKTGGRRKGTPNKRTQQVAEVLRELDCDPIRGMAKIAANTRHPIELRAKMYTELAHYVYPKRKAVDEHHDGSGEPFKFTLNIGDRGKGNTG